MLCSVGWRFLYANAGKAAKKPRTRWGKTYRFKIIQNTSFVSKRGGKTAKRGVFNAFAADVAWLLPWSVAQKPDYGMADQPRKKRAKNAKKIKNAANCPHRIDRLTAKIRLREKNASHGISHDFRRRSALWRIRIRFACTDQSHGCCVNLPSDDLSDSPSDNLSAFRRTFYGCCRKQHWRVSHACASLPTRRCTF